MFALNFLIPLAVAYGISSVRIAKEGVCVFRKLNTHLTAAATVIFSLLVQMLLFMDFTAFLSFSAWKLFASVLSSLAFVCGVLAISRLRRTKSFFTALVLFLGIALFLEITVFNFRFYQTAYYEETDVTENAVLSYHFTKTEDSENRYKIKEGEADILIRSVDRHIDNIYVGITAYDEYGNIENLYVEPYFTDESNTVTYIVAPEHTVHGQVESTKYLYILTNGETEFVQLNLTNDYAVEYEIDRIAFNVPTPFNFSIIRLLVVFFLMLVFWILRPHSTLWSICFNGKSAKQRALTCAVIVIEIILLIGISFLNPAFHGNPSYHTQQYQQLAESFMDGKLYLDVDPPEYLADMENPYDYGARRQQADRHDESYYWDAAYFEGRYYVYFGVVPVLLLYLPYLALTGKALPNMAAINVCQVFFVIGAFLLIGKIIEKYFSRRKIPYLSYLILSLIFVNASCGVFIAKRPDFYSVPILSAVAFTVWGLYLWISSVEEGRVNPIKAGIGSLCMALVAGCRPQLLVASVIAVIIFWNLVFSDRTLFSKRGFKSTVAVIIPYILVAAGIMWYNYARFGSPFDFGANYNLTTNDMTGRGFRVERVGLAAFTYLFQLPNIVARFPFLRSVNISTGYLGLTVTESMFGGIFATIPLLWIVFLIPRYSKYLKRDRVFAFSCTCVALSVFLALFDAQGAGLLQRYVNDFAFLACLGAIFAILSVIGANRTSGSLGIKSFQRFSLFASGTYCAMIIFAKYSVEIYYRNPYIFNKVAELVEFW